MSGATEYYERIKRENELKQDEGGVRGVEEEMAGKKSHGEG